MVKANRLLKVAQSLMKQERWRETIKMLKGNSAQLGKDWELLWNLGWCYFKLERYAEAQRYLTKATQLAPKNHACKFALGSVFLRKSSTKKQNPSLRTHSELKIWI